MVVGSFKKIVDSQRIEFIPQVQSVVDPGVTGSKHMGDTSTRLVRFPTLIVPEQAGHSVASVVTATNPLSCSLGPTVTCRDGTCVHLPGYCHESRLKQSSINWLRFVLQHDTVYRSALYYQKNGRGSCVPEIILSPSRTARLQHRECSSTGHDSFSNEYALMASSLPILKAACMSKRSASLRDDTDSIRLASLSASLRLFRASAVLPRSANAATSQALTADFL